MNIMDCYRSNCFLTTQNEAFIDEHLSHQTDFFSPPLYLFSGCFHVHQQLGSVLQKAA